MKYKCVFAFFFLCFFSLKAQNTESYDDLKKKLNNNLHDTVRVNTFFALSSKIFQQGNFILAIDWSQKALALSQKIGYKTKLWPIYNQLANAYVSISDYPNGIINHQKALNIGLETNNKAKIAASYNNIGIVYYNLSDFVKTIDYFQKSLKMQEERGDNYKIAATIGNIAVVYADLKEDSLSMVYQKKSFEMHEKMNNQTDMVASLNNLGALFRKKKEYEKALGYHKHALQIAIELNEVEGLKSTYGNIGVVNLEMKNLKEALTMFFKSLSFTSEHDDKKFISALYTNIGRANKELEKSDDALSYLKKAFDLSKKIGAVAEQKEAADELYLIYKEKNDFKAGLFYHEIARQLNDSIFNISKNESFNSLKTQFALDRQENNLRTQSLIELQKKEDEKTKQRIISYIAIIILAIVVVFSYFLFQRFRLTRKQNKIIENQKIIVEQKNKEITDSIHYAKRIQEALLPNEKYIANSLNKLHTTKKKHES